MSERPVNHKEHNGCTKITKSSLGVHAGSGPGAGVQGDWPPRSALGET